MQPIPHANPRQRRIVLVEDDEVLAMLLRYNLEAAGFAVETTSDGIGALSALVDRPPALVILDWNVPSLSGIEILRQLKQVRSAPMPVLMLTARTEVQDRERAIALGVDAFIGKPFAIKDLMATIAWLLERSSEQMRSSYPVAASPPCT